MLFQSSEFLGWFLPTTVLIFFALGHRGRNWAIGWLVVTSLFFYAWWIPQHLPILAVSILVNHGLSRALITQPRRRFLAIGVILNLLLLGYFKYAWFIVDTAAVLTGADWGWQRVVLPLGISFFTFQQIAFLADCQAGLVKRMPPLVEYALFVTFFPQLIAGPIVHHREMMGQFEEPETFRPRIENFTAGLTCFSVGLFKKVIVADSLALTADTAFGAAGAGEHVRMLTAWTGAIAFTLQIYFDFSGYSDMALGLARIFGIDLPLNFASPFKSRNIIEFWRTWHMSLTRFFNGYLYNPLVLRITRHRAAKGLPLHRRGKATVGSFTGMLALPTLLTMFLIGIWHGAGFQFAIFGLMHGFYMVVNHAYRILRPVRDPSPRFASAMSIGFTFLAVVASMVFFRAETLTEAMELTRGLVGLNGLSLPNAAVGPLARLGITAGDWLQFGNSILRIGDLAMSLLPLVIIWCFPNTQQWLKAAKIGVSGTGPPESEEARSWMPLWRPNALNAAAVAAFLGISLSRVLSDPPVRFLYFNF